MKNRYTVEVPFQLVVPTLDIWQLVDHHVFGAWIQSNNVEANQFANTNYNVFARRNKTVYLRFLNNHLIGGVPKSDVTFWKPIFHRSTLLNSDIQNTVDEFYKEHMKDTPRTCVVISGGWQVWVKLWNLVVNNPAKYKWMIPVPGEWHWTWHIIKGIYRLYFKTILFPFAKHTGFRTLDEEALNFHYAEDFLEMITIAIQKWIDLCLLDYAQRHNGPILITNWLHSIRDNKSAYELAYTCIHYFIPYWETRAAIKANCAENMDIWWRYWIHLFLATGKTNYSVMSIRFLWELHAMHPTVRELYNQYRIVSLSGDDNSGLALDHLNELVIL